MEDTSFYKNLASSYQKTVHGMVGSYKRLEKQNKIIFIIILASLVLNIVFINKCFKLTIQNDKLNKKIKKEHDTNVYLKTQNENLWDTYYSGVSEYKYYE